MSATQMTEADAMASENVPVYEPEATTAPAPKNGLRLPLILSTLAVILAIGAIVASVVLLNKDRTVNVTAGGSAPSNQDVTIQSDTPKPVSQSAAAGALVNHLHGGSATCVRGQGNLYDCEYKTTTGKTQLMSVRVGDKNIVIVEHH